LPFTYDYCHAPKMAAGGIEMVDLGPESAMCDDPPAHSGLLLSPASTKAHHKP
jgi:hypothetical protein